MMERLGDAEMGRNISADRAPRTSLHLLCCLVAHFAPTNVHSKIGLKDNDFWWKYVKIKEQA
jgi:hypothetical protein